MVTLNVSFGIYVFHPIGWAFMTFVILCEAFILSKYLTHKRYDKKIYLTELLSNMVSGIAGIVTTLHLNGGWWLVMWFPWVTSHEVNVREHKELFWLIIYYVVAFILSLLIEWGINHLCLRKRYESQAIFRGTLLVNIVTYAIGAILLTLLIL